MSNLDWILVSVLAAAVIYGYFRGFLAQLLSIISLAAAYIAAFVFYDDLSPWLQKLLPIETIASYKEVQSLLKSLSLVKYLYNAAAFALILLVVKLCLAVLGRVLHVIVRVPGIQQMNKWTGALLAVVEAAVLIIVAVNVMKAMPSPKVKELLSTSIISQQLDELTPAVTRKFEQLWKNS